MSRFKMLVEFPSMPQAIAKLGIDEGGDIQEFVTDEVVRNLPDFMPQRSGKLVSKLHKTAPALVKVDGPYARFLFFGITRSGAPVDYSKGRNPNGGPHWDSRMVADRGASIVAGAQRLARKRGTR